MVIFSCIFLLFKYLVFFPFDIIIFIIFKFIFKNPAVIFDLIYKLTKTEKILNTTIEFDFLSEDEVKEVFPALIIRLKK